MCHVLIKNNNNNNKRLLIVIFLFGISIQAICIRIGAYYLECYFGVVLVSEKFEILSS